MAEIKSSQHKSFNNLSNEEKTILINHGYSSNFILPDRKKGTQSSSITTVTPKKEVHRNNEKNLRIDNEIHTPSEIANINIESLNLSNQLKRALARNAINNLGEILNIDYATFEKMKGMGQQKLEELKIFIHNLGYTLKNERLTVNEKREMFKSAGVRLLEDDFNNSYLYLTLYKYDIYTIEDLLNFGPNVLHLAGFGPTRKIELEKRMKELNLSFDNSFQAKQITGNSKNHELTNPSNTDILKAKNQNGVIRARINKKQLLVNEYNRLMQENVELQAREQELDELLTKMKEVLENGRK